MDSVNIVRSSPHICIILLTAGLSLHHVHVPVTDILSVIIHCIVV